MSGTVLRVQGIPAHFSLFLRYFFREVPRNNRIEVCGSFSGGGEEALTEKKIVGDACSSAAASRTIFLFWQRS